MAANKEREQLKSAYKVGGKPAPSWVKKVDKMSDAQVIAVLRRLQSQNKI